MSMAYFVAMKSKDTSTKTGAVIVGPNNEIRSTGYNGLPRCVNDDVPERFERPDKYLWTEHAERNAVYNSPLSCNNCDIYIAGLPPCADCARAIIQSRIRRVVIDAHWAKVPTHPEWQRSCDVGKIMLIEAGVDYKYYDGELVLQTATLCNGKPLF